MATSEAIKNQINQLVADLNKQVAVQQQFGQTGQKAIGGAYADLNKQLAGNLGDIKGTVKTGRSQIGQDYNTAGKNIGGAEQTLRSLLGEDINTFNAPLQAIQQLKAETEGSRAGSLSSFDILGTGHINMGKQAMSDAAREGTQRKGDLQSQVSAEIGELQRTHQKERAAMEVQLAQTLAEERYRAEQLALERQKLAAENAARAAAQRNAERDRSLNPLQMMALRNEMEGNAANRIMGRFIDPNTGQPSASGRAFELLIGNPNASLKDVSKSVGSLNKNDYQAARAAVQDYYNSLNKMGYYQHFGGSMPTFNADASSLYGGSSIGSKSFGKSASGSSGGSGGIMGAIGRQLERWNPKHTKIGNYNLPGW